MSAGKPLRGLVYGLGRMGTHHARRLEARGDVEVRGVDPALGLAPPERPGAWDFAVIATPARTHAAVARPLLEAGLPCLIEKPLAADLQEAQELAAFPQITVGHVERFNPALLPLAEARPRFFQAERLAPHPGRGTDVDVLADLMVHDLDLALRFLPGELRDLRAVGVGVTGGALDIAHVRLELGEGVAVLAASRVSREAVRRIRLVEPGVYWSVDLHAGAVHRTDWGAGGLEAHPVPVPEGDALGREHAAFLAAVRGEAPYPVPASEALRVLACIERIRAETTRWVG